MKKLYSVAKAFLEAKDSKEATDDDKKGLEKELRTELEKLPPLDKDEINVALVETRDLLNKGLYEEAAKYLEGIVNDDESLGRPMRQLPYIGAFEQAFKTACRKHSIIAAFVIVETEDIEEGKKKYRLITGGMHLADAILSHHLKPLAESLGQDLNPKKAFLDIQKIEQRNPIHIK